jgi:hypothetical protein
VKTKSALVRAEGRIILDAVGAVDLHFSLVIDPRHSEDDLPLRLDKAFEQGRILELGIFLNHRFQRLKHLADGLQKLKLVRIAFFYGFVHALYVRRFNSHSKSS